jgi:phage gp16-like protein
MVHMAKKELGLDDETYRAVLEQVTRHSSAAECSDAELLGLVEAFKRRGWTPKPRLRDDGRPRRPSNNAHVRKVWAEWNALIRTGVVRNPTREALRAFVERLTGIADPEWLSPQETNRVVEALKAWRGRQPRPEVETTK